MIVKEASYEVTDATVNSQIVELAGTWRERFLQYHHAEVRRASDSQGL